MFYRVLDFVSPVTEALFILSVKELLWASLAAQLGKNPPAIQETWVRSLGWEDLLKKGKATHSSIPSMGK